MDSTALMGQSIALRQTANDLQSLLNEIACSCKTGESIDFLKNVRMAGYAFSLTILRALATELALKSLADQKTGKHRNTGKEGHDLLILFNDLGSEVQKITDEICEARGIAPLEKILTKHKDDFINWRYPGSDLNTTFMDLDKALEVLLITVNHEKFKELCNDR